MHSSLIHLCYVHLVYLILKQNRKISKFLNLNYINKVEYELYENTNMLCIIICYIRILSTKLITTVVLELWYLKTKP